VPVCFANPGTSEMHFVAALDGVPAMRGVLTLFEGVATGAADGYARMAGTPAATLLHLGPGLGNGLANLHNARRPAPRW
jgi:acetolactate synthase-1/2/3 large subunit